MVIKLAYNYKIIYVNIYLLIFIVLWMVFTYFFVQWVNYWQAENCTVPWVFRPLFFLLRSQSLFGSCDYWVDKFTTGYVTPSDTNILYRKKQGFLCCYAPFTGRGGLFYTVQLVRYVATELYEMTRKELDWEPLYFISGPILILLGMYVYLCPKSIIVT